MKSIVPQIIVNKAMELHEELLQNKQEVILIPAPDPQHTDHQVRVAQNQPPQWFSKFVNQTKRSSKKYPRLRPATNRKTVLGGLLRLSKGKTNTKTSMRLYKFIENMLDDEVPF